MSNTETFAAEIKINSQDAVKKVQLLTKELEREKEALNAMTREGSAASSKAIAETKKRIKELTTEIDNQNRITQGLNKSVRELSDMSYKELQRTMRALQKELRSGDIEKGSEEWEKYGKRIRECKAEMDKFNEVTAQQKGILSRSFDFLNKNWGAFTQIMGAITGLSMTIRKATSDYADMEQEMANVRKYTGQTDEEVKEMNEDFKKMDTRTSREELNQLAGAAGRLGLQSKKDIEEFVDAADKIGVALGDDLGDGAVDTIGKLAIAFGENDRLGLRGAMLATGSALNEIVQSSSAQAQPVVEFTKALSGVGQQAHLTQAQIMGLGSALDQNNQEMATSSTVMSQLITKMYQDPAKFASMAGLELKKFTELVKTDMNEALLTWFRGANQLGDMSVLAGAFDKLGMDGTRAVGVLSTLAGHIDQVTEAQRVANEAYEQATSVEKEFEVQNTTVQAELDKAKKRFKEMAIELGERLLPVVKYTISTTSLLTKGLAVLTEFMTKHSTALITLAAVYGTYLVASKADLVMTKTITAVKRAYGTVTTWLTAQQKAYTAAMVLQRDALAGCTVAHSALSKEIVKSNALVKISVAVTSLLKAAYYALTFQFGAAKVALQGFNLVLKANPWGAIATAIIAAGTAIAYFVSSLKTADKAAEEHEKALRRAAAAEEALKDAQSQAEDQIAKEKLRLEELNKTIHDNSKSLDDRKKAIAAIKKIVPEYHGSITKEGKLINDNTGALQNYITQLKAVAVAQAAFDKLAELNKKKIDAEITRDRKKYNVQAVEREIDRGTKSGEYATTQKSFTSGTGYTTYWEDDNDALKKKKEELALQKEALATAQEEVETVNAGINTVEKWLNSNKEYKTAYQNIMAGGNGFTSPEVKTVTPGYYKTEAEKKKEEAERKKEEAEREKEEAEERKALKERADTAKASYQAQVAEEMLAYRQGVTSYRDYITEKHNLTINYFNEMKKIYGEDSNEYKKLLDDREREENEYYQMMAKLAESKITTEKLERDHAIQMQFLDKTNAETYQNQELLNENLFKSEMAYMKQRQALYNNGSKEWEEWEQKMKDAELQHKFELEENYQKKLLEYRREFSLMTAKELEDIELQSVKTMYETLIAEGKMTEEEYRKIVQNIKGAYAELAAEQTADSSLRNKGSKALDTARKKSGVLDPEGGNDIVSIVGNAKNAIDQQKMVNDELKRMYEQGAIDYETYEQAKRQNARETADAMMAYASGALGEINQMLGSVSSYMQACSDVETEKIKKNYEAQIEAAGKNSKKREKLEKQRDEEIQKAKTKANKKAMAIEMAQAVASTAMAAINAYASAAKIPVTGWVMAPVAAGLATAAGMLQIATIKKQHQAEEAGYYSGGFTGGKNYRKEAGVVHEGEFVANHDAVNNKRISPIFDLLDKAQRNNMVGSLTPEDVTNVMGGPASAAVVPIVNVQTDNEQIRENLDAVSDAVQHLSEVLSEPIEAKMSMQHLDKEWKKYQNLLKSK